MQLFAASNTTPTLFTGTRSSLHYSSIFVAVSVILFRIVALVVSSVEFSYWPAIIVLVGAISIQVLLRKDYLVAAARVAVFCGTLAAFLISLRDPASNLISPAGFIVCILCAALMLSDRTWLFVLVTSILLTTIGSLVISESPDNFVPQNYRPIILAAQITLLILVAIFVGMLYNQTKASLSTMRAAHLELKELYNALAQSETQHRTMMNLAVDGFLLISMDGRIVDANEQSELLLGYSRKELLSLNLVEIDPTGTAERLAENFLSHSTKPHRQTIRTIVFSKDKIKIPVEVHTRLLEYEGEIMFYATLRDLRERLNYISTIQESKERLELISNNLPSYILYVDREFNVTYHNQQVAIRFGLERLGIELGDSIPLSRLFIGDNYESFKSQMERVFFEGLDRLEFEWRGYSGRYYITNIVAHQVDGDTVGLFIMSNDFTDRRLAKEELKQQKELLQAITDNIPARITLSNLNEELLFWNKEFAEHYRCEHLSPPQRIQDIVPEQVRRQLQGQWDIQWAKLVAGKTVIYELPFNLPTGEKQIFQHTIVPIFEDNQLMGLVTLTIDISELRNAEAALKQAQKLESMGVLAGGIAHDFNNLLVAMLGQTSLALAKMDSNEPARIHVVKAVTAAEQAAALTKQMLAYSGRGSFTITPLSVNELIQQNSGLFDVSIPKNIELKLDLTEPLPLIEADQSQIQQVIMNLIINASHAIGEEEGVISITTTVEQITAEQGEYWQITGDPLVPGAYVGIKICDNGKGMDKTTRERIFDPFFTTKEHGSGLGLAAVVGIIRGHNGGIHVNSIIGEGTAFHLLFPISTFVRRSDPDRIQYQMSGSITQCTVLVIDDEPYVAEAVVDMLSVEGIKTLRASNGREGIELYQNNLEEIDLVLLDLMMRE